jgi:hypothetical protein
MKIFKSIWKCLESISEGRRMRINKQVQEYVKNRT